MAPKDDVIRRWWPTTQSLDLVEGPAAAVGSAVKAEYSRFVPGEQVVAEWRQFRDLNEALSSVTTFHNVPTVTFAIPTRSRWTVLWNNSFLCDGYDALCWNLTSRYGLTTIHWSAHDDWTTFQSGARFRFRRLRGSTVEERSVYASQEDKKWHFYAKGQPLPEEQVENYEARKKRDRLNEDSLLILLERLGARPWVTDFYALPEQETFCVRRPSPPATVIARAPKDVLNRACPGP